MPAPRGGAGGGILAAGLPSPSSPGGRTGAFSSERAVPFPAHLRSADAKKPPAPRRRSGALVCAVVLKDSSGRAGSGEARQPSPAGEVQPGLGGRVGRRGLRRPAVSVPPACPPWAGSAGKTRRRGAREEPPPGCVMGPAGCGLGVARQRGGCLGSLSRQERARGESVGLPAPHYTKAWRRPRPRVSQPPPGERSVPAARGFPRLLRAGRALCAPLSTSGRCIPVSRPAGRQRNQLAGAGASALTTPCKGRGGKLWWEPGELLPAGGGATRRTAETPLSLRAYPSPPQDYGEGEMQADPDHGCWRRAFLDLELACSALPPRLSRHSGSTPCDCDLLPGRGARQSPVEEQTELLKEEVSGQAASPNGP